MNDFIFLILMFQVLSFVIIIFLLINKIADTSNNEILKKIIQNENNLRKLDKLF